MPVKEPQMMSGKWGDLSHYYLSQNPKVVFLGWYIDMI